MSKILIIDDEEIIIDSIKMHLKDMGYEIFSAANGKEGLSLYNKLQPVLIILDLKMPVLDGIGFLEEATFFPDDPCSVIVLTGHGDDEHRERCFELGVSAFLNKPFNAVELKGMVRHSILLKEVEASLQEEITKRMEVEELLLYNNSVLEALNKILIISLETTPLVRQLEKVIDLLAENVGVSDVRCNIYRVDVDKRALLLKAQKALPEEFTLKYKETSLDGCIKCEAVLDREIMYTRCRQPLHKFSDNGARDCKYFCTPIMEDTKFMGILNLYTAEDYEQTPEDMRFISSVSNIIAGMFIRDTTIRK